MESLEQARLVSGGDSDALIAHAELERARRGLEVQLHGTAARVLERVGEKVAEGVAQEVLVERATHGLAAVSEGDPAAAVCVPRLLRHALAQFLHVERLRLKL